MMFGFTLNKSLPLNEGTQIIDKLFKSGYYEAIEIRCPLGSDNYDPKMYNNFLDTVISIAQPSISCHLSYHAPFYSFNPLIRQTAIDYLKTEIEYGQRYGAKLFPFHAADFQDLVYLPEIRAIQDSAFLSRQMNYIGRRHELTLTTLRILDESLNDGEFIVIENMPTNRAICVTASDIQRLVCDANCKHVGAMIDVGHMVCAGRHAAQEILALGQNLKHIHISDNMGRYDNHLHLGKGQINFHQIADALTTIDYNGTIIVESIWENTNSLIDDYKFLQHLNLK